MIEFTTNEARESARIIFEKYSGLIKDRCIPVEQIAEEEGIKIITEEFEDATVAGFIQIKTTSGQPVIVVNENNSPTRQRFTIAHELGHYFLHKSQSIHVDDLETAELVLFRDLKSSQATHIREIEANGFAAELLMPRSMIEKDVEELKKKNSGMSEIVEALSKQYKVSQSAMAIRLNKFV